MSCIGFKATTTENEVHNTLFAEEFSLNVDDRHKIAFNDGFTKVLWGSYRMKVTRLTCGAFDKPCGAVYFPNNFHELMNDECSSDFSHVQTPLEQTTTKFVFRYSSAQKMCCLH
jgi:hypothetical protein